MSMIYADDELTLLHRWIESTGHLLLTSFKLVSGY
jgi:hypothetical protein